MKELLIVVQPSLDILPVEMWDECWGYLQVPGLDKKTLGALALTCQLFCHLCQPRLFSHLSLDSKPSGLRPPSYEDALQMCRRVTELASAPEAARLRAMVKSWGFSTGNAAIREMIPDFLESDTIQLYDATEEKFVRSLSFYPNLQIISLKNITVDSVFLGSLSAMPKLETLHLTNCVLPAQSNEMALNLREFTVIDEFVWGGLVLPTSSLNLVSPHMLGTLSLGAESARRILPPLMRAGDLPCLINLTLYLPISMQGKLGDLLRLCPQLESLSISVPFGTTLRCHDPIPLDVVPLLKRLDGPMRLAKLLAVGRQLHTLQLREEGFLDDTMDEPSLVDIISLLDLMSRMHCAFETLRTLHVRTMVPSLHFLATVADLFPRLLVLHVQVMEVSTDPVMHINPFSGDGIMDYLTDDTISAEYLNVPAPVEVVAETINGNLNGQGFPDLAADSFAVCVTTNHDDDCADNSLC